jgi:hypothetical protein
MPNSSKSELSERDLLRVELPETRYHVDMQLFEQGQSLSAELLKLSLAGIAVVGVLLPLLPKQSSGAADSVFKLLLAASVMSFAIAAAAALLQRFFASSGMFHHIKAMKIAFHSDPSLDKATDRELHTRLSQFIRAHTLLKATAILLAIGVAFMGAAFVRLMYIL